MVYNGYNSAAETVGSGIPQGTVIGPGSFLTFIDDITDDIDSAIYLFADDTKAYRSINQFHDCNQLQSDIDKLVQFAPLICTSFISTLRIFARRASGPIRVYVMSMAVNFAYKH